MDFYRDYERPLPIVAVTYVGNVTAQIAYESIMYRVQRGSEDYPLFGLSAGRAHFGLEWLEEHHTVS